ncbi:MAG: hypothetical protein IKK75_04285 [Clostridia bacterium]|nr:hypothetical protein [Clostridia bacterium]
MLQLFPVYKKRMLLNVGIWIGFLAVSIILFPNVPPAVVLLAGVAGTLVFMFLQYMHAVGMHNGLLNVLYNEMDVDRFLRQYEPLVNVPVKNNQLYLMVRLHLSNAYCAQGRFEDAISLLRATEVKQDKPEKMELTRFAIASNLCYCAEQMHDLDAAQKHLDDLLVHKSKLEELQRSKPEKKRMTISTALNEQCMKFLKTGKADIEFLKSQVQANNNQQLHRITTSLWIARAYLAENNRREAEKLLKRIVELAPSLYPGKAARELLDQLPD